MDTGSGSASGSGDVGARSLGTNLMREVEVESLTSLLGSLRQLSTANHPQGYFGIPELDTLLPTPTPLSESHSHAPNPPVLELVSPPPPYHPSGAGKTSLLYLIAALAILPASLLSVPLSGQNAAIIIFDPLSHFNIRRLAEVMTSRISSALKTAREEITIDSPLREEIQGVIMRALTHVHIFRPQSWDILVETLAQLPTYLFTPSRHKSANRKMHSIILEDLSSFTSSIRSASTSRSANQNPLTTASTNLTSLLHNLSQTLSCAILTTSHSFTPKPSSPTFRAPIPTSWPHGMDAIRLVVRRVEVLKFVPGMSAEEAEAGREKRWEVVARGRFECWRVGRDGGKGFVFRVGRCVEVERDPG